MEFVPNRSVITKEPTVTVAGGLPVGKHHFQLVVENKDGDRSTPVQIEVTIVDKNRLSIHCVETPIPLNQN